MPDLPASCSAPKGYFTGSAAGLAESAAAAEPGPEAPPGAAAPGPAAAGPEPAAGAEAGAVAPGPVGAAGKAVSGRRLRWTASLRGSPARRCGRGSARAPVGQDAHASRVHGSA